ncbi:MAG TPA: glutamate-cysteine ligase family protein [Polyangiaceae bacterium]|jgi:glutamate--cysteine ligase
MADVSEDSRPLRSKADLLDIFHEAEKPPTAFLIGAEAEKFAVHARTLAPLDYEHGVTAIFARLAELGWQPERESAHGPTIALRRAGASITLEPGAQLELSGAALPDIHAVRAELDQHFAELAPISQELELIWLGVGFQPLAHLDALPWVPKQRYAIMRQYLPTRGSGAHDMMQRTATVQANFDFSNESDAMIKLVAMLRLSPLINALTANSPFAEGARAGFKSRRGYVWLNMDPARSGLLPELLRKERPGYSDYAEWALDAGMFLVKRGERAIANTGQTFRDFLEHGYQGERATFADWKLHLNTLFPEVRLKNTLEVRCCDCLPARLGAAVPALLTGLLYDERALAECHAFALELPLEAIEQARMDLVRHGLEASIGAYPARQLAERLVEIAEGGLARRRRLDSSGNDERVHLAPLSELIARGHAPADELLAGLSEHPTAAELIARCRL